MNTCVGQSSVAFHEWTPFYYNNGMTTTPQRRLSLMPGTCLNFAIRKGA